MDEIHSRPWCAGRNSFSRSPACSWRCPWELRPRLPAERPPAAGDDRVVAGRGADNVHGGHGDDRVLAGRGDDRFWGGGGDDYVRGGRGADRLNSGVGNDTVIVSRADGEVDSIDWGSGVDRAVIHSEDNEVNCEDVKVIS